MKKKNINRNRDENSRDRDNKLDRKEVRSVNPQRQTSKGNQKGGGRTEAARRKKRSGK